MTCAIYCRLSKEDEDKREESESIQNQKALLVRYAAEEGWEIYKIYSDEDYSGIDRSRPGFNALIADAGQKKFDIVLCKTQSRFTRDMELVEKYIHHQFLLWGIRFVTVVDHIDTQVKGNKKARQINGLINEWYLEDLSENIRAVFDQKRRSGQYIGSFPVYGYEKDPGNHNHLIVDEQAARVVRKIFGWYLGGNGKQHIAYLLNQEGIPNPTKYKQGKGYAYVNAMSTNTYGLWNRTTVGRILKNQMYIGTLVQGVKRKVSYKSKRFAAVPKEEWICIPDSHAAIIDEETFRMAQLLMETRTRTDGTGDTHSLAGRVRCMDCGSILCKTSHTYQGERRSYLRCKLYTTGKSKGLCTSHSIRLDALSQLVEDQIREYVGSYYEVRDPKQFALEDDTEMKKAAITQEISSVSLQIRKRSDALKSLYLDKTAGIIDREQFADLNETFAAEKKSLTLRLEQLEEEHKNIAAGAGADGNIVQRVEELLRLRVITRELVSLLIDTIQVSEKNPDTGEQNIKINWTI
ncbi:recombinase family protein [Oscillospiraceae bacterium PP1C4]